MSVFAVIDTNVLVSAQLNSDSVPGKVLQHALVGDIVPIMNDGIIAEYEEVLRRRKFQFKESSIRTLIHEILQRGIIIDQAEIEEILPDPKDVIFYAVTMEARKTAETFLVTANIRHFPVKPFVVTPREMLTIIENHAAS